MSENYLLVILIVMKNKCKTLNFVSKNVSKMDVVSKIVSTSSYSIGQVTTPEYLVEQLQDLSLDRTQTVAGE